jgi:hypothetical protein
MGSIEVKSNVSEHQRAATFLAILIIVLFAAILCVPFLLVGIPDNGDAPSHMMFQYHFSRQFWAGELYPRWLAEANKGYGSPNFVGMYPLPYFITALLRPILSFAPTATRESHELGVYCFLVLAGAGLSAWVWFRHRCTVTASTVGAVAYMTLPFILGQSLYWRVAIGELTSFVWMPLMFTLCDRVRPKRFAVLSAIAVAFAFLVMSNALYAIMFILVIILYAAALRKRAVLPVLFALVLGICIAAVYVFPLAAYQRFFDMDALIIHHPLVELGRNFLYISLSEVKNYRIAIPAIIVSGCLTVFVAWQIWRGGGTLIARTGLLFILVLGIVVLIPGVGPRLIELGGLRVSGFESYDALSLRALVTALLTLELGLLSYSRIPRQQIDPRERVLAVVACGAFLLMLPWSAGAWSLIPKTAIIQFPWRICAILSVASAGLFAMAIDNCLGHGIRGERGPSPVVMICCAFAVVGMGNLVWRVDIPYRSLTTPHVDVTRWLDPVWETYISPQKLAGFAETVGASPDFTDVAAATPVEERVRAEFVAGKGDVSVVRVAPRKLLVSAQCQGEARVKIGQTYFPLWSIVPIIGSPEGEVLGSSAEGLIEVSLTAGEHDFELVFRRGLPEIGGAIVSVASILGVLGGLVVVGVWGRKRKSGRV